MEECCRLRQNDVLNFSKFWGCVDHGRYNLAKGVIRGAVVLAHPENKSVQARDTNIRNIGRQGHFPESEKGGGGSVETPSWNYMIAPFVQLIGCVLTSRCYSPACVYGSAATCVRFRLLRISVLLSCSLATFRDLRHTAVLEKVNSRLPLFLTAVLLLLPLLLLFLHCDCFTALRAHQHRYQVSCNPDCSFRINHFRPKPR